MKTKSEHKKRGRKPGQKNKLRAKFIILSDLNKIFKPETKIPVDFSLFFNDSLESVAISNIIENISDMKKIVEKLEEKNQTIQLTIHENENK